MFPVFDPNLIQNDTLFEYGGSRGPAKLHEAQLFYMCFNYLPVGDLQGFFSLEKKVYKAWTNGRRPRL